MNCKKYTIIGIATFITICFLTLFGNIIGLYNQEVSLRNKIEAKQTENMSNFDNMWKKIKQSTNVTDKYKDGLKEVLEVYTLGRSDKSDNMLMKWGAEAVPNFDSTIYKQLNNIIVASRDDFALNQRELIDLKRAHDNLITVFPNNIVFALFKVEKIDIKVVTSTKTQETFDTQLDNEVQL